MNSNLSDDQLYEIRNMLLDHPSFEGLYDDHVALLPDLESVKQPGYSHRDWYLTDVERISYNPRHRSEIEAYLVNAMLSNLPNHTAFCSLHDGQKSVYQVIRSLPPDPSVQPGQYVCTTIPHLYAIKPSPIEALYDFWLNY